MFKVLLTKQTTTQQPLIDGAQRRWIDSELRAINLQMDQIIDAIIELRESLKSQITP